MVADSVQPDFSSPLLIDEPPLQVLPALAIAIGLNEAIVLQQLHYLLRNPQFGRRVEEHKWIFNTFEQWVCEYFPFWSVRTVKTIFTNLANMRLIVTCQPEGRLSRRKYYRIDFERFSEIADRAKNVPSKVQKSALPITKTTNKEAKEAKETAEVSADSISSFPAQWKPNPASKADQLRKIPAPKNYPSQVEFERFCSDEGIDDTIDTYRPDIYSELCDTKWHQWRQESNRWIRIRDWKSYVIGLANSVESAKGF